MPILYLIFNTHMHPDIHPITFTKILWNSLIALAQLTRVLYKVSRANIWIPGHFTLVSYAAPKWAMLHPTATHLQRDLYKKSIITDPGPFICYNVLRWKY